MNTTTKNEAANVETVNEYSNSGWSGRGTLQQLVTELDRQLKSKVDFVADSRQMTVANDDDTLRLKPRQMGSISEFIGSTGVEISDQALIQIGAKASPNAPTKFLRSMASQHPEATADLLNTIAMDQPKRRFVRCLDDRVRAWLSDSYRVLDNYDLAVTALSAVRDLNGEVFEAALNDTKMRLKFTTREIFDVVDKRREGSNWYSGGLGNQDFLRRVAARTEQELPGGPGTVHPVVTVTNSETGQGGLNVRIGILQGICFNLATVEQVMAQVHLGQKQEAGIFSQETLDADAKAIMLKAQDAIKAAFDQEKFSALIARVKATAETPVTDPSSSLGNIVKATDLNEGEVDDVLKYFLKDYGGEDLFGLSQAIARISQNTDSADRADALEAVAGKVMMTPQLVA